MFEYEQYDQTEFSDRPKSNKKKSRRSRKHKESEYHPRPLKITPKSTNQKFYIDSLYNDPVSIAYGFAGTGKTFLAASVFANLYLQGVINQIIITKPSVECGESLGYLKGGLDEKFDPYIQNLIQPIRRIIGDKKFKADWGKNILAKPLQYCRGDTYDHTGVIVDEAQNCTMEQLHMITTRMGVGSKLSINGDTRQADIKEKGEYNPFGRFIKEIRRQELPIDMTEFRVEDNVRSEVSFMFTKFFHEMS